MDLTTVAQKEKSWESESSGPHDLPFWARRLDRIPTRIFYSVLNNDSVKGKYSWVWKQLHSLSLKNYFFLAKRADTLNIKRHH
jgi:hypothetical protein